MYNISMSDSRCESMTIGARSMELHHKILLKKMGEHHLRSCGWKMQI